MAIAAARAGETVGPPTAEQERAPTKQETDIMKTMTLAAALAALIAAVLGSCGGDSRLPQTFNDQGRQVSAFPGGG